MVQRYAKSSNDEPEQKKFDIPSQKEHLFQVVEVFDIDNNEYGLDLGPDDVSVKCEVVGGEEEGRSILIRLSLDDKWKGFFATRLFLKAIGEPYKGDNFPIDTENWQGRQFYATVEHTEAKNGKTYANIKEYNFDKIIKQKPIPKTEEAQEEVAWDDDM